MDKSAKIYIAGDKGLVGSAIRRNLESKGYTNLIGRSHSELDLIDRTAVKEFFDTEKPEYVILAAAKVGGIMANNTYRADFIYDNLAIEINVIGESYLHGVKKLIVLGSTCIYPRSCSQPIKEEYLLTDELEYTNEPYAIAKIAGLKMCESFNIQYGTNYIALMPTNLYGYNDNFDLVSSHVLPAMIRKIYLSNLLETDDMTSIRKDLATRPIPNIDSSSSDSEIITALANFGIKKGGIELWGSGTPLREFLWSDDMADAAVYIMERVDFNDLTATDTTIRNTHINIGTGYEISIKELAQLIASTIGYKGDICFDATKPDGTMRKVCDVTKLHSLGWSHTVEIEKGVKLLFDWYHKSIQTSTYPT